MGKNIPFAFLPQGLQIYHFLLDEIRLQDVTKRGAPNKPFRCFCSENLLSPTIFGLKYDEKTGVFFNSDFRDMKKVMPFDFGEIKMSFWVRKKGQLAFSEKQQVLGNSGNNINFLSLEFSEV